MWRVGRGRLSDGRSRWKKKRGEGDFALCAAAACTTGVVLLRRYPLHKEVKLLQEHRPSGPWRGCPRGWLSPGVESFSKTKGVAGLIGFLACRATDCEAGRDYFPGRGCNGVRR